jgi:hypothetical protein
MNTKALRHATLVIALGMAMTANTFAGDPSKHFGPKGKRRLK